MVQAGWGPHCSVSLALPSYELAGPSTTMAFSSAGSVQLQVKVACERWIVDLPVTASGCYNCSNKEL